MGMRITNTMLVNNMSGYISKNLTKMQKYQYMIANGKKIELPSDDPVVAARSLKFRTDMAEVEQYKRNVEDANSWLETTEIALGNVGDVMQRVRELSVEAASEHIVDGDLLKINDEIKQLRTQLINIGNTTYAGRYIFSGFGTNTPLLNEDGEFINDVLNTEKIRYEIGIGDNMNVNVLGGDIFNAGDESIGAKKSTITGTTDITLPITIDGTNDQFSITVDEDGSETVSIVNGTYETMEELVNVMQNGVDLYLGSGKIDITYQDEKLKLSSTTKGEESLVSVDPTSSAAASLGINVVTATDGEDGGTGSLIVCMNDLIEALDDGDNELVGEMLGVIDDEMNNILRVRADVGARQNRLELTSNRLENDNINFTRLMSLNEDVDMAETIMMLKNEENVYNASLSGGAKIIMPTLVDFLR